MLLGVACRRRGRRVQVLHTVAISVSLKSVPAEVQCLSARYARSALSTRNCLVASIPCRTWHDFRLGQVVAALQHPGDLDQRNRGDEPWLGGAEFCLDQAGRGFRLFWTILGQVPHDNVGVQADHWPLARFLIARFISSTERGFLTWTMPRSSVTSRVVATTS